MTMIGNNTSTSAEPRGHRDEAAGAVDQVADGRQVAMVIAVHDAHRRHHDVDDQWIAALSEAMVAIHAVIDAAGGVPVAVLGDRMISSFTADRVDGAIGAAITIHRRSATGAASSAAWSCSIGLAAGEAHDGIAIEGLPIPTVGGVVDRALQLCALTQPGAILADDRTTDLALGGPGAAGDGAGRAWSTGTSRVVLGPGAEPMECWDLSFDRGDVDLRTERRRRVEPRARRADQPGESDLSGENRPAGQAHPIGARPRSGERSAPTARMTPAGGTDATEEQMRLARERRRNGLDIEPVRARLAAFDEGGPAEDRPPLGSRRTWSAGHVVCWFEDRGRGVIAAATGQEFYVDRRFLIAGQPLARDGKVFFVPRDPIARGRNPIAGAVLVEGSTVEVRIAHIDDRGFGFAEVADNNQTRQLLLLDLTGLTDEIAVGDWLLVVVRAHTRGPVGLPA